jgi:branched-chain amino acid transport system substrate-binding protein
MGMKGKFLAIVAAVAMAAGIAVTAASGAKQADPGITASSIKIGGTFPLTGFASTYKIIPTAENAYFQYVNDRGGVNGRKIDFKIVDDAYDPSKTVPLTQQLVEQEKVFAIYGSLGTATNLATWDYLNRNKVPQVLLATGDSYWGFSYKKYPWTIGFQPDYPGESKIYGKYINANLPNAKIGVIYQNDAFGKNYLAGLRVGLGAQKSKIVSTQPFDGTTPSVQQQILALKASGADTLVIFATPAQAIQSLVLATKTGWNPANIFLSNVAAVATFMKVAAASGANINGMISAGWLNDVSIPTLADTAGGKLGRDILAKYAPTLDPTNSLTFYGLADAWTMVYALQKAGKNLTRAGLIRALKTLDPTKAKNPFLFPGVSLQTKLTGDNFPIETVNLVKWNGGATGGWQPFGKIYGSVR